jgi:transposase InsO family protein
VSYFRTHKLAYSWRLGALYGYLGCTRQAFGQAIARLTRLQGRRLRTIQLGHRLQEKVGHFGPRLLYLAESASFEGGRDYTERVLLAANFGRPKALASFTKACKDPLRNLIEGLQVVRPNQLWQTDITYFWVNDRHYYLSFILDVYTRKIVHSYSSKSLKAEHQANLLKTAIKKIGSENAKGLIIHTDRGVQYRANCFKKVVKDAEIVHSMAHYSWENAYCERLHRTLKQGYLRPARIQSFKELQKVVAKSVYKYNTLKPHVHLPNKRSPIAFINWIKENPKINTYVVDIWTELTHLKTTTLN